MEWDELTEREKARARDEALERLPALLRVASRTMDHLVRELLARDGLEDVSLTGLDVLVVSRHGKPVVAIADSLGLTPQAVSQVVSRLEQGGLVEKWPHPRDGRAVLVRTTYEGAQVIHQSRTAMADALDIIADDLVEGRLPSLVDDLARIAEVGTEPHPWGLTWR